MIKITYKISSRGGRQSETSIRDAISKHPHLTITAYKNTCRRRLIGLIGKGSTTIRLRLDIDALDSPNLKARKLDIVNALSEARMNCENATVINKYAKHHELLKLPTQPKIDNSDLPLVSW